MSHYTPETIPDDPYRVAPPCCAPGKVEPPDAPQVSNKEATARVIDVLLSLDLESKAFGRTADDWAELLVDFIVDDRGFAHFVFAIILGENGACLPHWMHRNMEEFVGDHANNWLAEADKDELEREGFL